MVTFNEWYREQIDFESETRGIYYIFAVDFVPSTKMSSTRPTKIINGRQCGKICQEDINTHSHTRVLGLAQRIPTRFVSFIFWAVHHNYLKRFSSTLIISYFNNKLNGTLNNNRDHHTTVWLPSKWHVCESSRDLE